MKSVIKFLSFISCTVACICMLTTAAFAADIAGIQRSLKSFFPEETISVKPVGKSVALTGNVSNMEASNQIISVVEQFVPAGNILNLMKLRSEQQVMLQVKVGELKREALERLGLGVQGIISGGSTVIGALEKDDAFKTLAEPTLTAISGQSAKFLAGGEFPVPVSNAGAVSIQYKPFGVSVNFTPTVISNKRIRIDVGSEVSEIMNTNNVQTNTVSVPSIGTRRANTTIELAPGESFMIAGLIRNDFHNSLNKVPGLSDIPVLGLLFKSTSFKRNESELVIAVTPYLASPTESKNIKLPTDDLVEPGNIDRMFLNALGHYKAKGSTGTLSVEGSSGFLVD